MRHILWFMTAFNWDKRSFGILTITLIEKIAKGICVTIGHIKISFHSAFNAFTSLERKHDGIWVKSKPLKTNQKYDITLWEYCCSEEIDIRNWTKILHWDKHQKEHWNKEIGINAFYPFCFMGHCPDNLQ